MIESLETWAKALQVAREFGICGLGIETTGQDPLTSRVMLVKLALPINHVYIADIFALGETLLVDLAVLVEDARVKKVLHNAKYVLSFFRLSLGRRPKFKNIFDTMLASQLVWAGYYDLTPSKSPKNPWKKRIPDHSLEALTERHLGIVLDKSHKITGWSAKDIMPGQVNHAVSCVWVLLPLQAILQELIIRNGLERVAELEFRTILPIVEMELSGIHFDADAATRLISRKEVQIVEIVMNMQAEAKKNGFFPLPYEDRKGSIYINPDCPEEIKRYFRSQGFCIMSTRSDALKELAWRGNAFADMLLSYRLLSHQLAFLENWLTRLHPTDGRIHPSYFQLQAATGRLSSRKPNAQQVPKRGEGSQEIRRLFKAPFGKKLVKVDFSCIEMRIMAHLSGDQTMIKSFQDGQDTHCLTASRISGMPLDQVTKDQRQAAKIVNFLLIYGGSAETLQQRALFDYGVFMTLEDAREAREKYFEIYSGVKEWHRMQLMSMNYTHRHYFHNCVQGMFDLPLTYTFTALGRRRVWPRFGVGIKASKFQAYNTPSQGTGADLIKMVMCELYDRLVDVDVKIIGSIHDELLLEVPEGQAEAYAKMLSEIMNRIGSELLYPVPVTSEAEILSSWGG